jgi:hypothetical protein
VSCVLEKDCKRASETLLRAFDLTWFAARKWRAGMYVASGTKIRARPLSTGSEQPTTGYQYSAQSAGWTGEDEPAWPTDTTPVADGSTTWVREATAADSLERTIGDPSDVVWNADSPMTISDEDLDTAGGQLVISALHAGGTAGVRTNSWADVTFSDGSVERFQIQWKIQ